MTHKRFLVGGSRPPLRAVLTRRSAAGPAVLLPLESPRMTLSVAVPSLAQQMNLGEFPTMTLSLSMPSLAQQTSVGETPKMTLAVRVTGA